MAEKADKNQIFDKIKSVVTDQTDINPDDIKMDANFKDNLDLDSLDIFEIVDALEDAYDIEIDSDEGMETVSDLVDYVAKQIDDKDKK
ncbi:acyl carrier protein [Fructilactobacillus fructivorans]|uniref:Acyl carrier protein n=1 Tax=Fructilactobacillus fructivorans TaxID=1614 RepID=A0A0C1LZD4_9LACO|nr:acyl carrier protein [Fructilactobacillus fructivorans]KID42205.1 Acyl carrier protein [Fructilactobacillus fructivorans]KRN12865.1 acyl carrier protein [Fructilactobacillus fructivorans]KRN40831.1 acyl carrier protein [Fructilactobacillus fructivorans]KRN42255.1 acyl carrier protein [Fructilactobacillus fructivorans]MCT0151167.1 acyl carrier protein [Fructilactobacillus fructivorans]